MERPPRRVRGSWIGWVVLAVTLTFSSGEARAQSAPSATWSGGDLSRIVQIGDRIRVTDVAGRRVEGRVGGVTPVGLRLQQRVTVEESPGRSHVETRELLFLAADVRTVARPGPIWDGAIKGFGVGAVFLTLGRAWGYGDVVVPVSAISAGIGLGIDALFGPKTIYRAGPATRLSIAPILDKTRRGVTATIRF